MNFFVFSELEAASWFYHLETLRQALVEKERDGVLNAYTGLFRALSQTGAENLVTAVAEALLYQETTLSKALAEGADVPAGLTVAAQQDLEQVLTFIHRDWHNEACRVLGRSLPPPKDLAAENSDERLQDLIATLKKDDPIWLLSVLTEAYKQHGAGLLAKYKAFRWVDNALEGIAHPVEIRLEKLVGLERQLAQLKQNTLTFLRRFPAQHTLLYGPRGSGKSTAIRGLLTLYEAAGLRLIEVSAQDLTALPDILEHVRNRPHFYILFVDDLSFEGNDSAYHPLKTLLEGSLIERPTNILIYASSNRRHLVNEQFSDRPDPLNDDVHGWDTHNERLALADRFGLTITFPSATQQRYLELVTGLAAFERIEVEGLEEKAIRFADWGNGYSGRTAQQFIDALKAEWV